MVATVRVKKRVMRYALRSHPVVSVRKLLTPGLVAFLSVNCTPAL